MFLDVVALNDRCDVGMYQCGDIMNIYENKTEILHISAIQTKITQLKKLILSAFSIYISQVEAKRTEQVLHLHFQNVHVWN